MRTEHKQSGFTIIEVVLVLAIAGLIFLIVFLALPALQRSQRDTQRRNDAGRALGQLSTYKSNNRGDVPTTQVLVDGFRASYLLVGGDQFSEPNGTTYTLTYFDTAAAAGLPSAMTNTGLMQFIRQASCNGENVVAAGGRAVALRIKLEGGGVYCQST